MSYVQAFILGSLQGVAEFLPISSSGHLLLLQNYWKLNADGHHVLYDLFLHIGTLLPILLVFRCDLGRELRRRVFWERLMISMFPTVVIALCLSNYRQLFTQSWFVGLMLCCNAAILWLGHRLSRSGFHEELSHRKAFWIGCAQGLAVLPGISRSGTTISAALGVKVKPEQAFFYSFSLALPTIAMAFVYELYKQWSTMQMLDWQILLIGFLSSSIIGFGALILLRHLFRAKRLDYFAIYCLAIGLLTLITTF